MSNLSEKYKNYDREQDPNGAQGIGLANAVAREYGPINVPREQWEKWKTIAFRKFPPLGSGDKLTRKDAIVRLRELGQEGYEIVSGYSRLKRNDAWAYLRGIKRNIHAHLENLTFG